MRLDELRAKIHTASELLGIVGTMRALSETRFRLAQRSFASSERYARELRSALERGLELVGPGARSAAAPTCSPRSALVVLGTEHGFVGALNEKIVAAAERAVRECPAARVLVLGSRVARALRERRFRFETQLASTSTPAGIETVAESLTQRLADALARGDLDCVVLLGAMRGRGAETQVRSEVVLPLSPHSGPRERRPPRHYLPPPVLVARLIEEYLFARSAQAVAEVFLSEQSERLRALDATRRNLDEKLEGLRQRERVARQEAITTEILEVVAGADALAATTRPRRIPRA